MNRERNLQSIVEKVPEAFSNNFLGNTLILVSAFGIQIESAAVFSDGDRVLAAAGLIFGTAIQAALSAQIFHKARDISRREIINV